MAPTFTPALNIAVVTGLAGTGSWLGYLIATAGILFVGASIATLARRHPLSGSYFIYIGRTFWPLAGALTGWALICAYLFAGVAVLLAASLFLDSLLTALGLAAMPPSWVVTVVLALLVLSSAYQDVRVSSRTGLALEGVSVAMVVAVVVVATGRHGTLFDPAQTPARLSLVGVAFSLAFAVFSFVGFESAASLAQETRRPERTIPLAILLSAAAAGLFFTVTAYLMVLDVGYDVRLFATSGSPLTDMAAAAELPWAAAVIYLSAIMSAFGSALACVTALSRLIFSMGRFGFVHPRLGSVHTRHRTPHIAVVLSAALMAAIALATARLGLLDAFGYTGTLSTFGFLFVYLLVTIVSPVDLWRAGELRLYNVGVSVIGAGLMIFVIVGSLYPAPAFPYDVLPFGFGAYLLIGLAWFAAMRRYAPAKFLSMVDDREVG